ncbi:MAG: NAD(P)/FAD-dependent oxidoreductase, partial [Alphaproteobacteria bacterium]|nr:NAD(P)/FAD-dependent oxidoreductase [Alphaproteobacteria bacterium]
RGRTRARGAGAGPGPGSGPGPTARRAGRSDTARRPRSRFGRRARRQPARARG